MSADPIRGHARWGRPSPIAVLLRAGAVLPAALIVMPTAAVASENGTVAYPTGLYTVNAAAVPPPGATSVFSFTNVFDAGSLVVDHGQSVGQDFHATVIGQAFRVLHTWNIDLGGIHVSSAVAPVFVSSTIDNRGKHFSTTDIRQIFLTPAAFTFGIHNLRFLVSEDVFIPTGRQKLGDPSSVALGYYNFATMVAATWNPTRRIDASAWFSYNTTTRNGKTDYKTGDYVNLDYGLLYAFRSSGEGPSLELGGYYLKQISADQRGTIDVEGNRVSQLLLGPMLRWRFSQRFAVLAKWQHPLEVRDSARGDRFWLQLAVNLPHH